MMNADRAWRFRMVVVAAGVAAWLIARATSAPPRALAGLVPDRAAMLHAVGERLRSTHDTVGALAAYEQALRARRTDDLAGQLDDRAGRMLLHQAAGAYEPATREAEQIYALVPWLATRPRRIALLRLTDLMLQLGNTATARRLLDEALPFAPPGGPGYAALLERLGLLEQMLGHPRIALRYLRAAQAMAPDAAFRWAVYTNLLGLAIEQGELREASELIAHAPEVPDDDNDRKMAAYYRALLQVAQGRLHEAVRTLDVALAGAKPVWRPRLQAVRGRALLRAGLLPEAIAALKEAVEGYEAKCDDLTSDELRGARLAKLREPFEDLFLAYVEQHDLRAALDVVQHATSRTVLDRLLAPLPPARGLVDAGVRAARAHALLKIWRDSLAVPVPSIEDVLARVHGHHVVTYFRAGTQLWAIAARTTGELVARRIGDAAELRRTVEEWLIPARRDAVAERLGLQLLPDALAPAPGEVLYVVTDAPIREVTFASLVRHGRYVIEDHPIAYALGLAALAAPPRPVGVGAVVIGDAHHNLPGALREALVVAARLGVAAHVGAEATLAAIARSAGAAVLHLAGHSTGTEIPLADGALDLAAVLDLGPAPTLVTLLGCSSARSKDGNELGSLAVAFLAAGAHDVVAALWAADDQLAPEIADELYGPTGPRDAIQALARAQRKMIRDHRSPEQWSTFVVFGGLSR